MFLLLCFVLAYGVMRLWEDATARWRHEPPPRHEYRMAKLKAREENGGKLPRSPLGRYTAGLLDDVWDSAHDRHELGRERRREKREFKEKKKLEKQREKHRQANGEPAAEPAAAPAAPAPAALPAAAAASAPDAPGTSAPSAPAPSVPTPDSPPTPAVSPVPEAPPRVPLGFYARVPQVPGSPLAVTSEMTPEQRAIVADWLHDYEKGGRAFIPGPDYRSLPADVRAAIMARVARDGGQHTHVTENGQRQSLAESDPDLAAHLTRNGIALPKSEAGLAREADAALQRGEKPPAGGVSVVGAELPEGPATPSQPVFERARLGILHGNGMGLTDAEYQSMTVGERAALLDLTARGNGTFTSVDTSTGRIIPLHERDPEALKRLESWGALPPAPDLDVADRIARAMGFDGVQYSPPAPDKPAAADAAPAREEASPDNTAPKESGATGSNVIPFPTVSTDAAATAAVKEYPTVTTMTGEATGLDAAINYAEKLENYMISAQDGITNAAPDPDQLAQSCEQALADLTRGGVQGDTLTAVTQTQELVVKAAQEVKEALATFEAAQGTSSELVSKLKEQLGVQEAYHATPDAGHREFVTNGSL